MHIIERNDKNNCTPIIIGIDASITVPLDATVSEIMELYHSERPKIIPNDIIKILNGN
jgi:hypothetical protein